MTEMSPAEEVFFAALDKATPEARAAYLDAACAGRPELRARVEKLLAAQPKVGGFLEPEPVLTGPHVAADPGPSEPPRLATEAAGAVVAGKYKLLQKIGEGGMGTVWMADQTEPVKRRVAVRSMYNLANSYSALHRHDKALKLHEETLATRRRVLPPDHQDILWSMNSLAASYGKLNRHAEALRIIDEAIDKAKRSGGDPRIPTYLFITRLRTCQKLGEVAGCRATAEMWEKRNGTEGIDLYNAACFRAVTASLQAKAKVPDAARLAMEEADKAMVWLTRGVTVGFRAAPHMRIDSDLDFLRDREDFKQLLAEVEKKIPPSKEPNASSPEKK